MEKLTPAMSRILRDMREGWTLSRDLGDWLLVEPRPGRRTRKVHKATARGIQERHLVRLVGGSIGRQDYGLSPLGQEVLQ